MEEKLGLKMLDEKAFREEVSRVFSKLEKALSDVDPDILEFELSQGSGILIFKGGTKCILSVQPSVRQLWLAAATQGVALHFNFDAHTQKWRDDKNQGHQLFGYLEGLVLKTAGLRLSLA